MAFPEIFLDGRGDLTISSRGRQISLGIDEWLEHLMWHGDHRAARHRVFCFVAFSVMQRHRAMGQGSYARTSLLRSRWFAGYAVKALVTSAIKNVLSGDTDYGEAEQVYRQALQVLRDLPESPLGP